MVRFSQLLGSLPTCTRNSAFRRSIPHTVVALSAVLASLLFVPAVHAGENPGPGTIHIRLDVKGPDVLRAKAEAALIDSLNELGDVVVDTAEAEGTPDWTVAVMMAVPRNGTIAASMLLTSSLHDRISDVAQGLARSQPSQAAVLRDIAKYASLPTGHAVLTDGQLESLTSRIVKMLDREFFEGARKSKLSRR